MRDIPRRRRDTMACGCFWTREPGWGDVLTQCRRHRTGASYDGSAPMSDEELRELVRAIGGASR